MDGVGIGQYVGEHGVAAFVEGHTFLFRPGQDQALPALAHEDPVTRCFEVFVLDDQGTAAHSVQGGLVDQVGQVGTAHPGGAPGDLPQIDRGVHLLVLAVHLQDGEPLVEVRKRNHDLTVESPWAEDRGVEDVGPVGRGHDDDALGGVEAVHLREHLVERLLALVVAATESGAPLASDGVDLVDEDDGRRLLASSGKEIADPAGTDADEHLHEVRTADRHERHAGLTSHGTGQKGLAGARRAHQQDPLRDPGADLLEPSRRLQEVNDLADLQLHAVISGDVAEGRRRSFGRVLLRLRLSDRHDAAHLALGPATDEVEDPHDQSEGDQIPDERDERVLRGRHVLGVGPERLQGGLRGVGHRIRSIGRVVRPVSQGAGDHAVALVDGGRLDLLVVDLGQPGVVGEMGRVRLLDQARHDEDGKDHDHDDDGEDDAVLVLPGAVRIGAARRRRAVGGLGVGRGHSFMLCATGSRWRIAPA